MFSTTMIAVRSFHLRRLRLLVDSYANQAGRAVLYVHGFQPSNAITDRLNAGWLAGWLEP